MERIPDDDPIYIPIAMSMVNLLRILKHLIGR